MKILVTGAAGFIGFHLVKKLLDRGDTVVGIDNLNSDYDIELKRDRLEQTGIRGEINQLYRKIVSDKYETYSFIRMDLKNRVKMMKLLKYQKFDIVCNLAAQDGIRHGIENPIESVENNILGFSILLEACRQYKISHLIYASSNSVYGANEQLPIPTSENVDSPLSLFAATKRSNELMAHTYSHSFGLLTTGLRFFNVYGPWGRPDMALSKFTKAILQNKPIQVYNQGSIVRDYIYIDDVINAIIGIIDKNANKEKGKLDLSSMEDQDFTKEWQEMIKTVDELIYSKRKNSIAINNLAPAMPNYSSLSNVYNIGSSLPVTLDEFITMIEVALKKKATKNYYPMPPGDIQKTAADISNLIKDIDYSPEISLQQGLKNFVGWYKSYYKTGKNTKSKNGK